MRCQPANPAAQFAVAQQIQRHSLQSHSNIAVSQWGWEVALQLQSLLTSEPMTAVVGCVEHTHRLEVSVEAASTALRDTQRDLWRAHNGANQCVIGPRILRLLSWFVAHSRFAGSREHRPREGLSRFVARSRLASSREHWTHEGLSWFVAHSRFAGSREHRRREGLSRFVAP